MVLRGCILVLICGLLHRATSAEVAGLNALDYRFGMVVDKEFASRSLSNFEGGPGLDVLFEMKAMWAVFAKEQLGNLPLKIEFHTRVDVILRKDLTAVILIASCHNMWRLYNNSEDAGSLLFLAVTEEDCPRLPEHEGVTVPLVARGHELSQILSDLRATEQVSWPSLLLITDATTEPEKLNRIIEAIGESQPNVRYTDPVVNLLDLGYFTSTDKEMIMQLLRDYKGLNRITNFLVVTSRENGYSVMEAAKTLGLVHPMSQWMYTLPESEFYVYQNDTTVISLLHEGDNVALLINSTRHSSANTTCSEGGLLCYCREMLRALVSALAAGAVTELEMLTRTSLDEWETETLATKDRRAIILAHVKESIADKLERACDGCVAWRIRSAITWGMKGPAGVTGVENATVIDVGTWRPGAGVFMKHPLFPHVKEGFRGKKLTVVSCHAPPWHEMKINESGYITHYSGFVFNVLDELGSRLNFTYKVVFPASTVRGFAAESRDATIEDFKTAADERSPLWDQMIDLVQQNKVFMAAAAISMSAGREMRVNFTSALASQPHAFLIARPRQMSRTLLFLTPFTMSAWLCIFFAALLVGPALFLVHRQSPANHEPLEMVTVGDKKPKGGLHKIWYCLWYVYGALLQQGAVHMPKADSSRIMVGTWWLVVLVVVTSYCGNLVAFLTFPRMEPPVTTLAGLTRVKGRFTWGLLRGSALETLLEDSSVPEYTKLLNRAERHADIDEELLNRVEFEGHVLLERRSRLLNLQSTGLKKTGYCAYGLSVDDFLAEQIALAMPLHSPYLHLVNKEIRRMQQAGLVGMWLRSTMPRRDRCWVSPASLAAEVNNHSVNLDDMQGSFILLGLGLLAAALGALLERCFRCVSIMRDRGIIKPFVT